MRQVIVNGYNVINCDEYLRRLKHQSLDAARRGLIMRLAQASRLRDDDVIVVFDGWQTGAGYQSGARMLGLRVVYSALDERADDLIKRLVKAAPNPAAVVVVSNDRELRGQCGMDGAHGSGSENLMRQAAPARRPRPPLRAVEAKDDDEDNDRHPVNPSKKGPAHRLPRKRRPGTPRDYRF